MQIQLSNTLNRNTTIFGNNNIEDKIFRSEFAHILKDMEIYEKNMDLRAQHSEIIELGKLIISKMDICSINEYIRKLKIFLKDASCQTFSFREEEYKESDGNSKYMATIEIINREINELVDVLKNGQIKQINLIARISGIHGLILNMKV